jgi:hypothetical protein
LNHWKNNLIQEIPMVSLIWLTGLLIAGLGGCTVWRPKPLIWLLRQAQKEIPFSLMALLRSAIGVIMLVWARACHRPAVIVVVGILVIVGGVFMIVAPRSRSQQIIQWFLRQPVWVHRLWGIVAAIFGLLVIWAGWPK